MIINTLSREINPHGESQHFSGEMGLCDELWPFPGLKGTIQEVVSISDDQEDPFCFYSIALEGVFFPTSIWFACHEVELIGFPATMLQSPTELPGDESTTEPERLYPMKEPSSD